MITNHPAGGLGGLWTGSVPHLAGRSGAESMGTGQLGDPRVLPKAVVNPLACCLGLGWLWPSPCYSIVIGRTGLGEAGPSASQPLPVPVVFLQEPELMGLSLGMLSLASLLGVRAAGSRVEVLLSVLLPGPRLAVSSPAPDQICQAPSFSLLASALFFL